MLILGIETSCDDTSLCLLERKKDGSPDILALHSFSQDLLLKKWGGVVPELAARNHLQKLAPLVKEVFEQAERKPEELAGIGVTTHPGLLGPLLTGLGTAKAIALYYKLPVIPVNHLHAHLEAIHIDHDINYPYLGLVVSGGHSMFMRVCSPTNFKIIGTTIDDAAGEAFDKGGKILGLGYPAGRIIDELARKGNSAKYGFPVGLKGSKDAQMSFSGVKTSVRQFLEKNPGIEHNQEAIPDICASYQEAIVSALKLKTRYALEEAGNDLPLIVGGGVASNSRLREVLTSSYQNTYFVTPKYCTDNGAMIANLALRTYEENKVDFPACLELDARNRIHSKHNEMQKQVKEARPR